MILISKNKQVKNQAEGETAFTVIKKNFNRSDQDCRKLTYPLRGLTYKQTTGTLKSVSIWLYPI
jgi:hypothetical protein